MKYLIKYLLTFFILISLASVAAEPVEVKLISSVSKKMTSENPSDSLKEADSKNSEELDHDQVAVGEWNFSLSLGYGQVESLITGVDDFDLYLLPNISYYGEKFYLENTTLGYSLFEQENFYIDLVGRLNEDGVYFKLDDFGVFSALGVPPPGRGPNPPQPEDVDRHLSYLAGLELNYQIAGFDLRTGYYHDISGVHHGYELDLSVARYFTISEHWSWYLAASATHKSKKLLNYYYGLDEDESLTSFFSYSPNSSGTNYYLTLSTEYMINDDWSWHGFVKRNYLADEIQDSLIIERKHIDTYFLGVKYRF
ncbi:MipA/OmpV family protein [Kangiella sp. TOML190]|uniref:MipA/OmpV family protein n=1 Tax=Kangiella sp. TOML190 TaxID=2931351 RepID=UPI0020417FB7|nr:MipA/OmpV family protein [Kangiella sp. TOML190]